MRYTDRDWLYKQYITLRKSSHQIAKENNFGKSTVLNWLRKFGIKRRSKSEALIGKKLSPAHRLKAIAGAIPFPTGSAHPNWIGGFQIERECEMCGKKFITRKDWVSRGRGRFCSSSCSALFQMKHRDKTKRTKIEIIMEEWLKENNIAYVPQFPIKLGTRGTVVDFFIEPNICLYCDGDYWHKRPDVMARDEKQNEQLLKRGYKVIRLWENDINNGKRPDLYPGLKIMDGE